MAKNRRIEEQLAALRALRSAASGEETVEKLGQALAGKSSFLAAEAALIAGERKLKPLEGALVSVFERLLVDGVKNDPNCTAKTAIAGALYQIGCTQEAVFLAGLRHCQMEPVYGGREDTAAGLRAACAVGLVRCGYPHTMVELAHLLADPQVEARLGAVRAIAYAQNPAGLPLLHYKALCGDAEARVLYECFAALLQLSQAEGIEFIAGFVDETKGAVCEAAILALGESRLAEAFPVLRAAWERITQPGIRRALLLAAAMLRHEQAVEFVLVVAAEATAATAAAAVEALGIYRNDPRIWGKVERLLARRTDLKTKVSAKKA